jgi:hypothetical protein
MHFDDAKVRLHDASWVSTSQGCPQTDYVNNLEVIRDRGPVLRYWGVAGVRLCSVHDSSVCMQSLAITRTSVVEAEMKFPSRPWHDNRGSLVGTLDGLLINAGGWGSRDRCRFRVSWCRLLSMDFFTHLG